MKKSAYEQLTLAVLVSIVGCTQTKNPEFPNQLLLNSGENSFSASSAISTDCSKSADIVWSLAGEYRKAVNEVRRFGKEPGSGDLAAALDKASEVFNALQEIHYQMVNVCRQQPGFDPDQYEPNNVWEEAYYLGIINDGETVIARASFHNPVIDQHDWYRISTVDPSGGLNFLENFELTVQLANIPSGSNYDLFLYDYPPSTPVAFSTQTGNNDEIMSYSYDGAAGTDDSRIFLIEARLLSGEATAEQYTLTATFAETLK
jgi:hypothetical protein